MNKEKVYLILPLEHGNGGWCGHEILAHVTLDWILKRNPIKIYLNNYYEPMFGSMLRLCKEKDPNKPLYVYDHEEYRWIKE